jgi:hypothetical protein
VVVAAVGSQDRAGAAADNRFPVSVVPVEEDSPAVSLSRVNADRADSHSRVAADFPVEGAFPEADKGSQVAADSPAAGRDFRASAAFLAAKDSGVAIVEISAVVIADIIAAAIAGVDTTDTVMDMDTIPVTATMAVIMAGLIATPMATMISGAIGIPIPSVLTVPTDTDTATSGNHAPDD